MYAEGKPEARAQSKDCHENTKRKESGHCKEMEPTWQSLDGQRNAVGALRLGQDEQLLVN
jgi:hypothetical protein